LRTGSLLAGVGGFLDAYTFVGVRRGIRQRADREHRAARSGRSGRPLARSCSPCTAG